MDEPGSRVLRVRRADVDTDSFVLLNVTSQGSRALDLKIVGTDGDDVYVATIQHNRISKLRAANYDGSVEEWETALRITLLDDPSDQSYETAEALTALECVSTVAAGTTLNLVWRRNIKGITQRLGTLTLTQTSTEEISLFDWASTAAQSASKASSSTTALRAQLAAAERTTASLTAQLDDLVAAKAAHERALLAKFAALVNAKKLKIRDLQRVLATAAVDERRAEEVGAARSAAGGKRAARRAGAARGKRKVREEEEEDESSDGFEELGAKETDDEEVRETPEPSGDETESEGEDEEEQPQRKSGRSPGAKSKPAETQSTGAGAKNQKNDTPPPRRELPFLREPPRGPKGWDPMEVDPPKPAAAAQNDDETDDEL